VEVGLEKVADGFDKPNGVFHARDDRLFVTEQKGRILVLPRQGDRFGPSSVFLDITRLVACCGERGILGVAFHPRYPENGLFYVTYSTNSHFFMLEERRVSDDPDTADPDYRREVLRVYKPHDYHWGGGIHFGPDGYLWLAMGDGGFNRDIDFIGDPDNDAQALDSLFGKVLRFDPLDPDGERRKDYTVPEDNPYVGYEGARPEIWAVGLRNPWRWSFDSLTGDLWLTDTGHSTWEEVNRARYPDLGKGRNYGWRLKEGPDCYIPASGCDPEDITSPPLGSYQHVDAGNGFQCAITGGQVYRGSRYPALASRFLFGDYCSGQLFSLDANGKDRQRPRVALETGHTISSLGSDADGELYITEYAEGAVYRVTGEPPTDR
jgi:glucose/arabinose dehydrogenase